MVEDIMTREVVSVHVDHTIEQTIRIFRERKFRHLPVVGKENTLVGVVSDRDVLIHISPLIGTPVEREIDRASLEKKVQTIMSTDVKTVTQNTPIHEAAALMSENKINCLPVVDNSGRIKGIVTSADLLRVLEAITLSLRSG